jgi:FkbM family methyltransferase
MIIALPNAYKADIGNDYQSFYVIHEIFYLNSYGGLSIKSSDFVLDCGAHIGLFTLKVARQCSYVVSVEPASGNFTLLQKNIALNTLGKKVIPIKRVITAKSGISVPLYLNRSGAWNSIYLKDAPWANTEIVESVSVDDLSNELNLRFDIIKIDVEGAELEALKGSRKTIRHSREVIVEYHSEKLLEECQKLLTSYGFDCTVVKPKRFNKSWVLGYVLLNSRLILHGQRPDLMKVISKKDDHSKRGILYACKHQSQCSHMLKEGSINRSFC